MGCYGEQSFLPQGTSYLIARIADCDGSGTACRAPTCTSFFIALHIGWGGMTPPLRGTISHGTLCGLRRYGHGMPCPYTHIIFYCVYNWIETGGGAGWMGNHAGFGEDAI